MKGQRKWERWEFIEGYKDRYLISNHGRIISLPRSGTTGQPRIVIPNKTKYGYLRIKLCKNDVFKWYAVHRLVALAFNPNPTNKKQVNHLDRDKTNNTVENLEWCTPRENIQHFRKNKVVDIDNLKKYKKFSISQIKEIREKYRNGMFQWELAKMFNTTPGNIGSIIRYETYKYA